MRGLLILPPLTEDAQTWARIEGAVWLAEHGYAPYRDITLTLAEDLTDAEVEDYLATILELSGDSTSTKGASE